MSAKPSVLFLCTGNSCRSQMAEGFLRSLRGEEFEPYSAGVMRHGVNPRAVIVMKEAGVDISGQESKTVDMLPPVVFDYVVTLCDHASENCPYFAGQAKRAHVGFEDPPALAANAKTEEEVLDCYRKVRDQIKSFVLGFPANVEDQFR
ncbi:arsenate reductase ArsC [Fundidesulfovibrio butyratiphilus]